MQRGTHEHTRADTAALPLLGPARRRSIPTPDRPPARPHGQCAADTLLDRGQYSTAGPGRQTPPGPAVVHRPEAPTAPRPSRSPRVPAEHLRQPVPNRGNA